MKFTKSALVTVILSMMSGASLAALPEVYVNTMAPGAATNVTGSTTLVSLDIQLSRTPATLVAKSLTPSRVTDANSLCGTTISYH